MVRLLLSLEGGIEDVAAPDGTTGLAVALGHGHKILAAMLLRRLNLDDQVRDMAREVLESNENNNIVHAETDKESRFRKRLVSYIF